MLIKKAINDFLENLEISRGLSEATLRNYHHFLIRFLVFAKKENAAKCDQIDLKLIHKYKIFLNRFETEKGARLKKNTQNYHIIALRSFLKYLAKNDIKSLEAQKVELAKKEDRQVEFLKERELERLLASPFKIAQDEIIQKRDKAILELLFSTGLRVSELTKLKIKDIDFCNTSIKEVSELSIRGKGRKIRVVFLSPKSKKYLKDYLDLKRMDMNPYLFTRHAKKSSQTSLTPRSIQRIVQKYAKIAGITKKATPHTMRHSYATDLLLNGADIRSVQAMLGHTSITTTQIYTRVTDNQLKDVYKNFHGKKRKKS